MSLPKLTIGTGIAVTLRHPSYRSAGIGLLVAPSPRNWQKMKQLRRILSVSIHRIGDQALTLHTDGQFVWLTEELK